MSDLKGIVLEKNYDLYGKEPASYLIVEVKFQAPCFYQELGSVSWKMQGAIIHTPTQMFAAASF